GRARSSPRARRNRRPSPSGTPRRRNGRTPARRRGPRSEEHTSELQSLTNLVCRLLLEKKKKKQKRKTNYDSRDRADAPKRATAQRLKDTTVRNACKRVSG